MLYLNKPAKWWQDPPGKPWSWSISRWWLMPIRIDDDLNVIRRIASVMKTFVLAFNDVAADLKSKIIKKKIKGS